MLLCVGCNLAPALLISTGAADLLDGQCRITTGHEVVTLRTWGGGQTAYEAQRSGTARLDCDGRQVVLSVHEPRTLAVHAPPMLGLGDEGTAEIRVADADGRELSIGRYARVEWEFSGGLEGVASGGCEFPPWCGPGPRAKRFVASTSGKGRVIAAFGDLQSSAEVRIISVPQSASSEPVGAGS
jgi:hypothetical protein